MNTYSTDQDQPTPNHHAEWWDEGSVEGSRQSNRAALTKGCSCRACKNASSASRDGLRQ